MIVFCVHFAVDHEFDDVISIHKSETGALERLNNEIEECPWKGEYKYKNVKDSNIVYNVEKGDRSYYIEMKEVNE